MIPLKLRLSNFMCYREEQTLDFSGIHLACLAGDNGHGKSALLDAMTWALWGRARARRDDELVALGETEMWVELEFDLGGQRYRIWRQRSKKGRGQSDLHFYVWNPTSGIEASAGLTVEPPKGSNPEDLGNWQLLDEGGLLERQALIIRTLRLDYDTFVNSAFLLQGKADSFTLKTAGERKQILADILGLSRYDLYEARAKEEIQARKERSIGIGAELRAIDLDLGRRPEYEAQLAQARRGVAEAAALLRATEQAQAALRVQAEGLRAQARALADLRTRLARGERDLADLRSQRDAAQARIQTIETVLAQQAEIEAGWAALIDARQADAAWNDRLLAYTRLQERLAQAQRAVDGAHADLRGELGRLADRHADLGRKVTAGQAQAAALSEAQAVLTHMAEQQARREALAAELRDLGDRAAALRVEGDRLKAEGQAVRDKMDLMATTETAACPLCQQPLGPEHRDQMLADLTAERQALAERYRAIGGELKALTERKTALEAEDADLARALRARDARQRQAAQAEAAVVEGEAAAEEQARLAGQMAALDERLAAGDYAPAERAALAAVQSEMAAIGYDAAGHAAVRAEVERWLPFDARYQRQLLPALEGAEEARSRGESLAAQLARRETELAEDQAERQALEAATADLPRLEAELGRAGAAVEGAAGTERRARQQEGAAMQQIDALDALAVRRETLRAELDALNTEISLYTELRDAFGKKGLQAMIIESAIPEVEAEANRLLGRMSDNRMSLRLETQREKVTGGVAETLDIIIADELGARPYEMFSGGEGFRANLALRIAISRLLARRAGAQLQTLIIDEGFGSQDAQGRSLVVEAINSIQHDFERIIVITHIEELKDLFPARIDVVKTAHGSRVSIV